MLIHVFMRNYIDRIKLNEGITTDCPTCSIGIDKEKNDY